jgi:Arc/MetJ-type ribon-helix-helix transcriptional regulator
MTKSDHPILTLRLPQAMHEQLRAMAKETRRSMSSLVREAIIAKHFLKTEDGLEPLVELIDVKRLTTIELATGHLLSSVTLACPSSATERRQTVGSRNARQERRK